MSLYNLNVFNLDLIAMQDFTPQTLDASTAIPRSVTRPLARIFQPKQPTTRWIAVGDSLVYGFGDEVGGGWVERIRRSWMTPERSQHVLYNLGVRGDGVRQVNARLEKEFGVRGELRNRQPDRLILSVGTNDCARVGKLSGRNMLEFERFVEEMEQLLDRAKGLCPVWFVGMVPIDESKMPFLDCLYYTHADQYRYSQATQAACESRGIPYLDLFALWEQRGATWRSLLFTRDGLHPNSAGYEAMWHDVIGWEALGELRINPTTNPSHNTSVRP